MSGNGEQRWCCRIIRGYELRLLRCTIPLSQPSLQSEPSNHHRLHSLITQLLSSIESANYLQALQAAAQFQFDDDTFYVNSVDSADRAYSQFLTHVDSFLDDDDDDGNDTAACCRVIVVMCIAVAALFIFTQSNLTGPSKQFPTCPLQQFNSSQDFSEWDIWASNQLMEAGSDLLGKFSYLQYIVFAKLLLMRTRDFLFGLNASSEFPIASVSWWLARVTLLQQRILDERSSHLFYFLQVLTAEALQHFGTREKVTSYWSEMLNDEEASNIVSMVHLEAGIMEYAFGRIDQCRSQFKLAELSSGLQLSVTGVLGFRAVHQSEPKAQMVLVPHRDTTKAGDLCPSNGPSTHESEMGENNVPSHQSVYSGSSDVLMTPKLLANGTETGDGVENTGISSSTAIPLKEIQQTVVLAQCLLIERSTRQDEMQRWDMAPYIEAIDSQQLSCFIIRCFCDILRIRWESNRSRTKERALLMMEKLVQGISESSPEVAQRILFCYGVYVPTISALQKEYGELLVSFGLIGEALKIFEELELWDNMILCYRLMEKKAAGVDLIKKRLSEAPNDPRLWCSLGDVTNDDLCYEKALEVSEKRSARAKRSLARSAYSRGDYEKSKTLWESAMALNSLYPDGWFALGAAALKARDAEKALDGFTRAVQLDPDNGEAWNNIACLHMVKKRSKEAFVAFKEALKYKRNSWQMWENYSTVALDVGSISQTLEAIKMVLELSSNKRVDVDLLTKVFLEIETKEHETGRSRETEHLVESLGKILQQIVKCGGGGDVWGLYARWHRMKGDLTMCSEALLKQVRSYQGSELWKDSDRFRKFARASLELCNVYMEISASSNSRRELCTAEMHIKNILRQAETFSETEEFRELQTCLDEVKVRLQSD